MKTYLTMTKRNVKLFFKDKGLFFTSLITPIILLVLYATFLANVYTDAFISSIPEGFSVPEKLVNGIVAGELFSSLLAVSCVTVSFCSSLLSIQDKVNGAKKDFMISPVKKSTLSAAYFSATLLSTVIVSISATLICFVYIAIKGWYLSFGDVMFILLDVLLLTLFGTALSAFVNVFLSTNGQAQAAGTIVSAGYGFLCGAYMPIASFSESIRNVIMFLPGTYGTSLIKNHALNGAFKEMASLDFASKEICDQVINGMKDGIDCNLYFFGHKVEIWVMFLVLIGAIALFIGAYLLAYAVKENKK